MLPNVPGDKDTAEEPQLSPEEIAELDKGIAIGRGAIIGIGLMTAIQLGWWGDWRGTKDLRMVAIVATIFVSTFVLPRVAPHLFVRKGYAREMKLANKPMWILPLCLAIAALAFALAAPDVGALGIVMHLAAAAVMVYATFKYAARPA